MCVYILILKKNSKIENIFKYDEKFKFEIKKKIYIHLKEIKFINNSIIKKKLIKV